MANGQKQEKKERFLPRVLAAKFKQVLEIQVKCRQQTINVNVRMQAQYEIYNFVV